METFELKPISRAGVPAALELAEQYRVLNEPGEAESICRDVLAIVPDDQRAQRTLLLALTDQLPRGFAGRLEEARALAANLADEFERAYYTGLVIERRGKCRHRQRSPGSAADAWEDLREAMDWFERADALSASDNDDAVLRWNACVRYMDKHPSVRPDPDAASGGPPPLLE